MNNTVKIFGIVILLFLILLCLENNFQYNQQYKENFLDPYSCTMFEDALKKHSRWNISHKQRFSDFRYYVPQHYKE